MIAGQLGLARRAEPEDAVDEDSPDVIQLGPKRTKYIINELDQCVEAVDYADSVVAACLAASPIFWPDASTLEPFADKLLMLAKTCRRTGKGNVGLTGGGAARKQRSSKTIDDDGYQVKHFTRMFVLIAEDAGLLAASPSPIDEMSVASIQRWLPDETGAMTHLRRKTCAWLRRQSGLSPFWVSCHACFAQNLKEHQMEALLNADDKCLWATVQKWMKWRDEHPHEKDSWPPSILSLGRELSAA